MRIQAWRASTVRSFEWSTSFDFVGLPRGAYDVRVMLQLVDPMGRAYEFDHALTLDCSTPESIATYRIPEPRTR